MARCLVFTVVVMSPTVGIRGRVGLVHDVYRRLRVRGLPHGCVIRAVLPGREGNGAAGRAVDDPRDPRADPGRPPIQRPAPGLPRMSPTLLSRRLQQLAAAGVVERRESGVEVEYELTAAGRELKPIVVALGEWGTRWIPELGDRDLDP